jgi:serine protease Do
MRAQLLHLSGPMRGRTTTYESPVVRIGSAKDRDAALDAPGVEPEHAQIDFVETECQFHLRRRDGATFVNGTEIEEVILQDGDQIEIGAGGPMLRFRVYVPTGAVCKPVRRMLADAADVARVSGGAVATQTLSRDLLTQATPRLKIGFPLAVAAAAFGAAWLGGWLGQPKNIVTRADLEALRAAQQQMQPREPVEVVRREDFERLRQQQQQQQEDLARLARGNATVRRIQKEWTRGVCLLHGVFRLRLPDGTWLETDSGPFECEYTGSGFRATEAGHVITNRHVVAPWLEMAAVTRLMERVGAVPEFVQLTATFPTTPPLTVPPDTIARRTDDLDVAVVRLAPESLQGVPVLPMRDGPPDGDDQRAFVVGFPTGLSLLLARADEGFVDELRKRSASMADTIVELARTKQIAPTITQGVLGNVQEFKIEYDAVTTHGGSGGPVFDGDAQVIAVNFAIMPDFTGANFGVPIRFARELLPK